MNEQQRRSVGEQVRDARGLRGWSQKDLAAHAGISSNTVIAIESGKSSQPGKLAAVLHALDIKPLAEQQARVGYPVDVELIRDAIGMWLVDLEPADRADAVRSLLRAITMG